MRDASSGGDFKEFVEFVCEELCVVDIDLFD